jgi:predicted thioesterase
VADVPITTGLTATVSLEVTDPDTAVAHGSGTLPVLATPRVVALVEEAAVAAVDGLRDDTHTTVGMAVQLEHLAPTATGRTVVASATVEAVSGRRVSFEVQVADNRGLVAVGRVTRVVVEIDRFMTRAD